MRGYNRIELSEQQRHERNENKLRLYNLIIHTEQRVEEIQDTVYKVTQDINKAVGQQLHYMNQNDKEDLVLQKQIEHMVIPV